MTHATITADLTALLVMRRAGLELHDIAEALGISYSAAFGRLDRAGIPISEEIPARASVRRCLSCNTPFISSGPGHRLCKCCRNRS